MWGEADNRWPAQMEVGLAIASALACWLWPQAGGWPLLLGLTPWLMRLARGRFPFQPTILDGPLWIFLASALAGVWAAYDPRAAWAKFWLMAAAALVAYALARQPVANLPLITALLGAFGPALAIFFFLTQDWLASPADLEAINRLGLWWMKLRPSLEWPGLHPNIAGGLMAFFIPFGLASALITWRKKRLWANFLALLGLGLTLSGLLMSSSRAAWLALAIALSLWGIWVASKRLPPSWQKGIPLFLFLAFISIAGGTWWVLWRSSTAALAWLHLLPGANSAITRLEIYQDSLRLVRDFAYTGGGLRSFPGLYSHVMRIIGVFLFGYAHNLFLDVALEQGAFGLGAWVALLVGSGWLLFKARDERLVRGAALSSLIVTILHGLVDDPLYAQRGTPFLFILVGLATAISAPKSASPDRPPGTPAEKRLIWAILSLGLSGLFLLAFNRGHWLASWEANLGAVEMARLELAGFPDNEWKVDPTRPQLVSAQAHLERALAEDASNVTALYRLGALALERDDLNAARMYLEAAYRFDANHRGVRKMLGYVDVWSGDFERAAQLLATIPEAPGEIEVYVWWWKTQGRDDLSALAEQMLAYLAQTGR